LIKYEEAIKIAKDGLKKCENFANKLCENSDFNDAMERHPSFFDLIKIDPILSSIDFNE
jgi:tRNA G26 N,N-dimethylase Trm1